MLLGLLLAGGAIAQDDLGVSLDVLEPDLDYLLETLEVVSCLCGCEDWCAGRCAGASSCEAWCTCAAEPAELRGDPPDADEGTGGEPPDGRDIPPAAEGLEPAARDSAPAAAPMVRDSAPADEEWGSPLSGVFSRFGEVAVPTCACIWRGTSCSAEASWPAAGGGCECAEDSPGCGGESTSISLLLLPPEEKSNRR